MSHASTYIQNYCNTVVDDDAILQLLLHTFKCRAHVHTLIEANLEREDISQYICTQEVRAQ